MPAVNKREYIEMLERAKEGGYAYPAINVTSPSTINAVLEGFVASKSDGIIQISTGGGEFNSGRAIKSAALGSISLAEHFHRVAPHYPVRVALHTDHCLSKSLATFVYPLIEETKGRRQKGEPNLFNSHMFDGSDLTLEENLKIAAELLPLCHENDLVLEIETGVVGGEEDGVKGEINEKLYTTTEDILRVVEVLGKGEKGYYILAATFGNVHGVYKPGFVKLKPGVLREGQEALKSKYGVTLPLVFHGGSGSTLEEIHETLRYGVVKMNIDTDTQYAYTRPIVDHVFKNYDGVLKIEGEAGDKKVYDPRSYLKKGEEGVKQRVMQACRSLKSEGKTLHKGS